MASRLAEILESDEIVSVYLLAFYGLLCFVPHVVAVSVASQAQPHQQWSTSAAGLEKSPLRERLGEAKYNMYERAEAAYSHSVQSFPLIGSAVIVGLVAHLSPPELNKFVVGAALLKALHLVLYIKTSTHPTKRWANLVWYLQVLWCLRLMVMGFVEIF